MDYETLARTLRAQRRALGLTQAETAELAEIDRRTLSEFERASGRRGISLRNVLSICTVLGLQVTVGPRAPSSAPTT